MDLKNQIRGLSLLTVIMILVFSGLDSYSQTKKVQPKTTQKSYDSVYVYRYTAEMTEEKYVFCSRKLVVQESDAVGLIISPNFDEMDNSMSFIVQSVGVDLECVEKSTMIILLDDGKKFSAKSYNDFNCKGTNYFQFDDEAISTMYDSPINKVYFENGYSYASLTAVVKKKDKRYLIQVLNSFDKFVEDGK
jgi:hypothetical protein